MYNKEKFVGYCNLVKSLKSEEISINIFIIRNVFRQLLYQQINLQNFEEFFLLFEKEKSVKASPLSDLL